MTRRLLLRGSLVALLVCVAVAMWCAGSTPATVQRTTVNAPVPNVPGRPMPPHANGTPSPLPAPSITCPTRVAFAEIASDLYNVSVAPTSNVTCQGPWAVAHVTAGGNAVFLLEWQQGEWTLVGTASSYYHSSICTGVPDKIRAVLVCG